MGTKVYNKLPGYIKEIVSYKAFKKEFKSFLLLHTVADHFSIVIRFTGVCYGLFMAMRYKFNLVTYV